MNTKATAEDVQSAYRLLLGRDPDSVGFDHYKKMILERDLSTFDLAAIFIGSEEFRKLKSSDSGLVEVDMGGYTMFVRKDDLDIGRWIMQKKVWEPHISSVVRERLTPGNVFLDVGANIGYYSALAAHLVGQSGRVISVEPLSVNIQLLYRTIWKNKFRNVLVFPFAASDSSSLVPMVAGGASSNGAVDVNRQGMPSLLAQAISLDSVLQNESDVDFVKLDVEGFELKAWRGMSSILKRFRPGVITEFHPKCIVNNAGDDPEEYLGELLSYGRGRVSVIPHEGGLISCSSHEDIMTLWEAEDSKGRHGGEGHIDLFVSCD